jgi:hypothetical protein
MRRERVSILRIERWLKNAAFRDHVQRMLDLVTREREWDIALGAAKGADLLHQAVDGRTQPKKGKQCRASATTIRASELLIRLARCAESRNPAERGSDSQLGKLAHPDVPDQQADQLLRELND